MTLGNRLRGERKTLGLSQAQLAMRTGIQTNAQGHYESGLRLPRADYLECLCTIGIDVQFILLGVRAPVTQGELSRDESAVIQSFRILDFEDRQAVVRIMTTMSLGIAAVAYKPP